MTDANDAFPSKYLRVTDLKDQTVPLTIEGHAFDMIDGEKKLVLYFFGKDGKRMPKGLVLNRTNANKIMTLTGTSTIEDWAGQRIALFPATTTYQGREVGCIRIQAAKAPTKPATVAVTPAKAGDDDIPF